MASAYPGALDSLAINKADGTTAATDHAAHHNDLADAVNKIEAELGVNPSANLSTVARNSWEYVGRQTADVTQASAAFGTNSGLVLPFAANATYVIELFLLMRSSLVTAGFRLALDTSVAVTTVALTFAHALANTGTVSAGQSRADATATGMTSGVDTINLDVPIIGGGILVSGANAGNAQLVYGPEVSATATLKANSVMRAQRIA